MVLVCPMLIFLRKLRKVASLIRTKNESRDFRPAMHSNQFKPKWFVIEMINELNSCDILLSQLRSSSCWHRFVHRFQQQTQIVSCFFHEKKNIQFLGTQFPTSLDSNALIKIVNTLKSLWIQRIIQIE